MAHEINEHDHMMSAGGITPWHGLGTVIEDAGVDGQRAVELSKTDWEVKQTPVCYEVNGQTYAVPGKLVNYREIEQGGTVPLGIVSPEYIILQNRECVRILDDVLADPNGPNYVTAGSLFNGRKVWYLCKFPDHVTLANGEKIEDYLLLVNSHDGSTARSIFRTTVRVVCNNTLTLATNTRNKNRSYKVRHYKEVTNSEDIREVIGLTTEELMKFKQFAEDLMNENPSTYDVELFFGEVFDNRRRPLESALNYYLNGAIEPDIHGTAWKAFNAVTREVDHGGNKGKNPENRFESVLIGNGADIKSRAIEAATGWFLS